MDARTIRGKINNNEYRSKIEYPKEKKLNENHIFDENQTVKWNRDEVNRYNESIDKQLQEYDNSEHSGNNNFQEDVIAYLIEEYGFNKEMASKVFYKAYEDGHSCGYSEVLTYAMDYGEFVDEVIKLKK